MRKRIAAMAVLATLVTAAHADPPNFDFYGFAAVPTTTGGILQLRSVLTNNGVVPTPIALDFATMQHTLVITATLAGTVGIRQNYSPATVQIWSDPIGGGTAADYANTATFTDGTMILSGSFDGNLERLRFTTSLGSFIGEVDFTGGTRQGELTTTLGWPLGGGWSRSVTGIPPGHQENWDGKIDPSPVGVEQQTWSGVKSLYH